MARRKKARQFGVSDFGQRRDSDGGNWAKDAARATAAESGNTGTAEIDSSYARKDARTFDKGKMRRVRSSGDFF